MRIVLALGPASLTFDSEPLAECECQVEEEDPAEEEVGYIVHLGFTSELDPDR
jgi:hypothetical protein